MTEHLNICTPENDPSVQQLLAHDVWVVPEQPTTHRGTILKDMTPRLNAQEIEISDEYFETHREEFPGIRIVYNARRFMEQFGAKELTDHEEMPDVRLIYDGMIKIDPRLNLHEK